MGTTGTRTLAFEALDILNSVNAYEAGYWYLTVKLGVPGKLAYRWVVEWFQTFERRHRYVLLGRPEGVDYEVWSLLSDYLNRRVIPVAAPGGAFVRVICSDHPYKGVEWAVRQVELALTAVRRKDNESRDKEG